MDIKSVFLNGFINEEVFVEQPQDFENYSFPNHIYILKKALYGLKQAPRAWYEHLKTFLLENNFKINYTLFSITNKHDILIVQIYIDNIIFGSTNISICQEFFECMCREFKMSLMGELNHFLRMQIK